MILLFTLLANGSTPEDLLGEVKLTEGPTSLFGDPIQGLGIFFGTLINIGLTIMFIMLLIYMLIGAINWITSGGQKENIEKARNRMVNAFWGALIYIFVLTLWTVLTGNILGIVKLRDGGFEMKIPRFEKESGGGGGRPCSPQCAPRDFLCVPCPDE